MKTLRFTAETKKNFFLKKVTISDKAQEASYLVAELVAKKMKSHTILESPIMPACKIIVRTTAARHALLTLVQHLLLLF